MPLLSLWLTGYVQKTNVVVDYGDIMVDWNNVSVDLLAEDVYLEINQ